MIKKHVTKLYGVQYCPALNANVAFVNHPTKSEMMHHSSKNADSTLFAVNIEHLLKIATIIERKDPKPNNKSQSIFSDIFILEAKVKGAVASKAKGHGTAKITIGKLKEGTMAGTVYCQYCVTRKSMKKQK